MLLRRIQRPRLALRSSSSGSSQRPLRLHQLHQPQHLFLQQHIQTRQLWGKSADLFSWLGLKKAPPATSKDDADKATPAHAAPSIDTKQQQPTEEKQRRARKAPRQSVKSPAAAVSAPSAPTTGNATTDAKVHSEKRRVPGPPGTLSAGGVEITMDVHSVRELKRAKLAFKRHVSTTKSGSQLLNMWHSMRSCEPFYIQDGEVHVWDATASAQFLATSDISVASSLSAAERPQVMQLIPLDTFVELTTKAQVLEIGNPSCFFGKTATAEDVLFLSAKNVVRQLVRAISVSKDVDAQKEVKALFEQYEADRLVKIDELLSSAPAVSSDDATSPLQPDRELLEDWTRLSKDTYAAYIDILVGLSDHKTVIEFFESPENIAKFLGSTQTLRKVLKSCLSEARGDLARRIIDDFPVHFPWLVLGKNSYQMAIQASFRSRQRTPEQLESALHVYRRMGKDAGYTVYPNIWSTLFNTCIYMKRHDEAVEVFGSYAVQQISPFQQRFTQALRTACKFEQYDTAIAMVRTWIAIEGDKKTKDNAASVDPAQPSQQTKSILENQSTKPKHPSSSTHSKAEREVFNKVLWEMLKGEPSLEQLAQVLTLMQERHAPAGAQVIRLLVAHFLRASALAAEGSESESDDKVPIERLEHLLSVWSTVPKVIERNGFVLHLVIDHCLEQKWEDECAYLVDYAVENKIGLPMGSIVKLMEVYERTGAFDKISALGAKLLRELGEAERARLSQSFFEVYLMAFLREQQFNEITRLNDELKLTERFPKSEILFTIMKDAKNA
ncbi:hypothetical protein Gpo141_00008543 [Globisporangium polare]